MDSPFWKFNLSNPNPGRSRKRKTRRKQRKLFPGDKIPGYPSWSPIKVPELVYRGDKDPKRLQKIPSHPFMVGLSQQAAADYGDWIAIYQFLGGDVRIGCAPYLETFTQDLGGGASSWHSEATEELCQAGGGDLIMPSEFDDLDHGIICNPKRFKLLEVLDLKKVRAAQARQILFEIVSDKINVEDIGQHQRLLVENYPNLEPAFENQIIGDVTKEWHWALTDMQIGERVKIAAKKLIRKLNLKPNQDRNPIPEPEEVPWNYYEQDEIGECHSRSRKIPCPECGTLSRESQCFDVGGHWISCPQCGLIDLH
jgi:predicted RNA-binding Zn-ribbon protein involved in translation (DUF1610 family)